MQLSSSANDNGDFPMLSNAMIDNQDASFDTIMIELLHWFIATINDIEMTDDEVEEEHFVREMQRMDVDEENR